MLNHFSSTTKTIIILNIGIAVATAHYSANGRQVGSCKIKTSDDFTAQE